MKKKLVKVIISSLMCLCLVGCQKAPEEVVENMKDYGENEQKEETEITYCTVSELKNTDVKSIVEKYDVNIPDDIDFSKIEEVDELTVKYKENFVAENEQKYADFFGFDISKLEELKGDRVVGGLIKQGDDEEKKINYGIGDNGFIAYMSGHWFDEAVECKVDGRYDILKDDISNVNIDFAGESVSLSDICKKNEDWFNANVGTDTLNYKVTDAIVRDMKYESEAGKKISLCGEFSYKGIFFNNHLMNYVENDDGTYKTLVNNTILSEYEDADEPFVFIVKNNLFEVIDSKKIDKIVDFESAVRIVEEKLSGFRQFEFCDVLPLYVMEKIGDDNGNIDPDAPGLELAARPVYAFLEKGNLSYDEYQDGVQIATNKYNRFVYVDMMTGEIVTDIGN